MRCSMSRIIVSTCLPEFIQVDGEVVSGGCAFAFAHTCDGSLCSLLPDNHSEPHRLAIALGCSGQVGKHPNSGDGMWGSSDECPSFLYAMPLGGKRVFLEETCLVAKPALPFAVLKRRLTRRLKAMGISVTKVRGLWGVYEAQCGVVGASYEW